MKLKCVLDAMFIFVIILSINMILLDYCHMLQLNKIYVICANIFYLCFPAVLKIIEYKCLT